jgi:hypothetical protein
MAISYEKLIVAAFGIAFTLIAPVFLGNYTYSAGVGLLIFVELWMGVVLLFMHIVFVAACEDGRAAMAPALGGMAGWAVGSTLGVMYYRNVDTYPSTKGDFIASLATVTQATIWLSIVFGVIAAFSLAVGAMAIEHHCSKLPDRPRRVVPISLPPPPLPRTRSASDPSAREITRSHPIPIEPDALRIVLLNSPKIQLPPGSVSSPSP